jgi:hypothetical protein
MNGLSHKEENVMKTVAKVVNFIALRAFNKNILNLFWKWFQRAVIYSHTALFIGSVLSVYIADLSSLSIK